MGSVRAAALLFALSAALAPDASAIFIKTQMDRIDSEPLFDSEYFLDVLSFSNPIESEDLWKSTDSGYRINGASLDCCNLLLQQDLRFQRTLVDGLQFKYNLQQRDDKDLLEFHQWLELEKAVGRGFSLMMFGEPTFHKEDADIGFGGAFKRNGLSVEYRHYFVDFNFNQRGSTTQRYDHLPATEQLRVAKQAGAHEFSGFLEIDSPIHRFVPDQNREFKYRRTTASAAWFGPLSGSWRQRAAYSYQFQEKGDLFTPDPQSASITSRRNLHEAMWAADGPVNHRDRIESGLRVLSRTARIDGLQPAAGIFYKRWEAQPYVRWRRQLKPSLASDVAGFLSLGELRARHPSGAAGDQNSSLIESKLTTGLEFMFGPSARIAFNAAWDVDSFVRHPWDGGNIRTMFLF